ncbi:single-stranded DNA-binding protein [Brevibacterium sp. RIT 803]|uniref:single-stranded DNA-binding protein n=1 Tax=Brevibacterium sp. RIT 803 TaxID=2810210 RepID=UPI00194F713D|nr:single-stranded DNA-binding protein [Brevibacterium sp. RIT 803]MBM6588808.1 single-stranded DNA-binding protein [Brevibacterium sp. RIT 803]
MAGETIITVVGNLTADPELRFTPNGAAVANFTIASTPRQFDRRSNEFKDGETLFLRCSAWKKLGENIAESLQRGTSVVAQGRLKSRSFETKEGEKRTVTELDVDEIGPSLKRATAVVTKIQAGGGGFSGQQSQQQGGNWGNQQQAQRSNGWGQNPGAGSAEPPF